MGKKLKKAKASPGKKETSSSLSFKGMALWICVTLFASAWMFVLGIFVGRGTAPVKFDIEKLQKELAALKETSLNNELRRYNIDPDSENNKTEMRFYETLKETKKEKSTDSIKSESKRTSLPKKKVSKTKKTESSKKPAPLPKTPKGEGSLTIQVAALKDSAVADKLVVKLNKKGYPAYRIIGKIPGRGIWYRVRVGFFKNKTEASSTLSKLKKDKLKPILVQR